MRQIRIHLCRYHQGTIVLCDVAMAGSVKGGSRSCCSWRGEVCRYVFRRTFTSLMARTEIKSLMCASCSRWCAAARHPLNLGWRTRELFSQNLRALLFHRRRLECDSHLSPPADATCSGRNNHIVIFVRG